MNNFSDDPKPPRTVIMPMLKVNLSPLAFRLSAKHYYKCKQDFTYLEKFSAIPYFLLCRSIELSIKARHLELASQKEVKDGYGHKIMKAYNELQTGDRILNAEELKVLKEADDIYHQKGFEYFVPEHAMTGYNNYPELTVLDQIANKFLQEFPDPKPEILD